MQHHTYRYALPATLCLLIAVATAVAHDSWVQTNRNIVRVGDVVHIDLMLGNHGNEHRDYRIAGKVDAEYATLEVLRGDATHDLRPGLVDVGYAPREGYLSARFQPDEAGLYMVAHTYDRVVSYAPTRSVKSGKTFFVASTQLDNVPANFKGYDRVLGHALEIVPQSNPVTPMGPGVPISIKLLLHGKPLADARVSFIPRSGKLKEGFDDRYERKTDAQGIATFEPKDGDYFLVAAHHVDPQANGEGYTSTKYSATMTVYVPAICPCCE